MGIFLSQQMLDAIKHITDDNFSFRKTAHRCTVHVTVQFSEKCDFHVFPFRQVVQKHKLFEVALLYDVVKKHRLVVEIESLESSKKNYDSST